jgi:hypothetical protein
MREERCQRVRAILARMSAQDREILVLRYLNQLSIAEVAENLGISVGAVKSRHMRALLRLRSLLDEDDLESANDQDRERSGGRQRDRSGNGQPVRGAGGEGRDG